MTIKEKEDLWLSISQQLITKVKERFKERWKSIDGALALLIKGESDDIGFDCEACVVLAKDSHVRAWVFTTNLGFEISVDLLFENYVSTLFVCPVFYFSEDAWDLKVSKERANEAIAQAIGVIDNYIRWVND